MANIVATLKILPTGIEIPAKVLGENIQKGLPENVTLHRLEEEPIAFGLVAIIVHLVMPEDLPGGLDTLEKHLNGIPGVGQIDTIMVRRV
jgi:elongation factor 1-beta